MTDPAQPVEATPETDAVQIDMERSTNPIEYQAQQYRDLARHLERELAEKKHELKQAHGVAQACEERAETAERQLSLAQTENAGHIRIEDELKSDLAQAQARCAELEGLLAEVVKDRDEATYGLGYDLVDRIDAALTKPSSR